MKIVFRLLYQRLFGIRPYLISNFVIPHARKNLQTTSVCRLGLSVAKERLSELKQCYSFTNLNCCTPFELFLN